MSAATRPAGGRAITQRSEDREPATHAIIGEVERLERGVTQQAFGKGHAALSSNGVGVQADRRERLVALEARCDLLGGLVSELSEWDPNARV